MTLEEEKELFKKSSDFAVNYYDHTEVVSLNQVDIVLNQIYNDHEAQIKAKDSITQDIKEAYEFKSIAYDLLLEAIKAKDEEIIELNHTVSGLNEMYLEAKEEIERLINKVVVLDNDLDRFVSIERNKARSIVAMLFWNMKKASLIKSTGYQYSDGWQKGEELMASKIFKKAYAMLKDKQ